MVEILLSLMRRWKPAFKQQRTAQRAVEQALASACVVGRRTIANSLVVRGRSQQRWDAEYKLFSRSPWDAQHLFVPALEQLLSRWGSDLLVVGGDDTRVAKTGRKVRGAGWGRDPLSPHFHMNLQWGLRFLHASVLVPVHTIADVAARAVPVWFELVPAPLKPSRRATEPEWAAYRAAKREKRLAKAAVRMLATLRERVDAAGHRATTILGVFDGSYCNKAVLTADLERTHVVARTRKDARLCFRAPEGSRRYYAEQTFTPDHVREDRKRRWQRVTIFHGGARREVRYKQVSGVLWRGGAGRRPLRLLVVAPTPYRKTKKGRLLYRQPAYLLTTDLRRSATDLLQAYFDRWQLEVAHREMKQTFGVGEAQVRVAESVAREPALRVATYSALEVAALEAWGTGRPECLGQVPKWQREKTRPSAADLTRQLRKELLEGTDIPPELALSITTTSILETATT